MEIWGAKGKRERERMILLSVVRPRMSALLEDLVTQKQKGWQLILVDGYPLGWGKLANGTLKNKYLPGWRSMS